MSISRMRNALIERYPGACWLTLFGKMSDEEVAAVYQSFINGRSETMSHTPVTPEGLARFDDLTPVQAVVKAWTVPGSHPDWHNHMKAMLSNQMPVLARALDRLAKEEVK